MSHWHAASVCTIDDFLSPGDCAALVARSEALGYEVAAVSTAEGAQLLPDLRDNDRVIVDDGATAAQLWARLAGSFPNSFRTDWEPVGVNERLRFYRYSSGQRFDWHCDGNYWRSADEQSHFTFMVYLNEGFGGGETLFRSLPEFGLQDLAIRPRTGTALLFEHEVCHSGRPVTYGTKYVLRSDVMFRRDVPS